jgi:hypothetical protein
MSTQRREPRKAKSESKMAAIIDDLRMEFHRHCERDAEDRATVRTTLDVLKEDVSTINRAVTKGANGKSLCERVAVIEIKVIELERATSDIWRVLQKNYKMRFSFWGPIVCSAIAAIGAVLVAILK